MNSDHILMFINYLLIPVAALAIDMRRSGSDMALSLQVFMKYVSYTLSILIVTYVLRVVISRLGIGIDISAGTAMYTIIATVIALIIPYVKEIFTTYLNVRCEIKGKKD